MTNTDRQITRDLATQVMGWGVHPNRYVKTDRTWLPSWRFAPLSDLVDAFGLLDIAATTYTLSTNKEGVVSAKVWVGRRFGRASGRLKPRVITLALAEALEMNIPPENTGPKIDCQELS